ncbi:MAG TPA: hypothetical protein VNK92_00200, partial [Vicinamibacterales bacterium]|nr:hypothetical protein [Vicinamibacterales bacterium]
DPVLQRYRQQRAALFELQRQAQHGRWNLVGAAAAVMLAVLALAFAGLSVARAHTLPRWIALAPLMMAAGLLVLSRPRRAAAARRLARELQAFGGRSLEELERDAQEEDRRVARAEAQFVAQNQQAELLEMEASRVRGEIAKILDAAGAPPVEGIEARAARYLEACRAAAERREQEALLAGVERDLARAREPERALARSREQRAGLVEQLRSLCAAVGVDAAAYESIDRAVEEALRRAREEEARRERARGAARELEALLGGETIEALEARERRLEETLAQSGESEGPETATTASEADAETLRRRAETLQAAVGALDARIADLERRQPEPAELEEQAARLEARIARLELERDAVVIAREALQEAARRARRDVVPLVRDALNRHLDRLTRGRYRNAVVDEDLTVRIEVPETGRMVDAGALSRGTQDQIYLLQRIALVRLLDGAAARAPLLLDDPFARYDAARLQAAVELVAELASERQVILFTEDTLLPVLVREICPSSELIELPAP